MRRWGTKTWKNKRTWREHACVDASLPIRPVSPPLPPFFFSCSLDAKVARFLACKGPATIMWRTCEGNRRQTSSGEDKTFSWSPPATIYCPTSGLLCFPLQWMHASFSLFRHLSTRNVAIQTMSCQIRNPVLVLLLQWPPFSFRGGLVIFIV